MLDAVRLCLPVEMEKEAVAGVPWAADLAEQHGDVPTHLAAGLEEDWGEWSGAEGWVW